QKQLAPVKIGCASATALSAAENPALETTPNLGIVSRADLFRTFRYEQAATCNFSPYPDPTADYPYFPR
ncbi:MAG TPA: hypothetical protein VF598_12725, partial [Hymenobacter sp.]